MKKIPWERFKFPPKILGYRTTRIRDEMSATMMEGVIVKPSAGRFLHEMIVIEKWSDQCQILHEEVIGEDTRLREKQPLEAFNEINKRESLTSKLQNRDAIKCCKFS